MRCGSRRRRAEAMDFAGRQAVARLDLDGQRSSSAHSSSRSCRRRWRGDPRRPSWRSRCARRAALASWLPATSGPTRSGGRSRRCARRRMLPFGVNLFVPGFRAGRPGRAPRLPEAGSGPRPGARAPSSASRGSTMTTGRRSSSSSAIERPAVVSFTFGCPAAEVFERLHRGRHRGVGDGHQPGGGACGRGRRRGRTGRPGDRGRRSSRRLRVRRLGRGRHRACWRCCASPRGRRRCR